MAENVSIVFSFTDRMSPALKTLTGHTQAFNKRLDELAQAMKRCEAEQDALSKKTAKYKTELARATMAAKSATAAYRKEQSEYNKQVWEESIKVEEKAKKACEDSARAKKDKAKESERLRKSYDNLEKEAGKAENKLIASGDALQRFGKNLMASGVLKMLAEPVAGVAGAWLTSAVGAQQADIFSGILGGALSGASAGAIAGWPGALVGAGVGVVSGAISGGTQIAQAKDDAFKSYYTGLYRDAVNGRTEALETGSAIHGAREQDLIAFIKRFGSEEAASAYLEQVKTMAANTGYGYEEIVGYSKSLLNGYNAGETLEVLQKLSDAAAGLDLSGSDMELFTGALSRMRTTGRAAQEHLDYFSERGVDAYQALADATGVDKSAIASMVSKGQITGDTAAEAILTFIEREFGGLSKDLMGTYIAMADNLEDIKANVEEGYGVGYNEERAKGMEAEGAAYEGELGGAMTELNGILGRNQAYMENLQEQYRREALEAVMLGKETSIYDAAQAGDLKQMGAEYAAAMKQYDAAKQEENTEAMQEAALKLQNLKDEAEAMATAAYDSSGAVKAQTEAELELTKAIRENTAAQGGYLNSYQLEQEQSKGYSSTDSSFFARVASVNYYTAEAVKGRARQGDGGVSANVTVSGNTFVVNSEQDAERVAQKIVAALSLKLQAGVRG